jgi:hypothetical protein
LDGCPKLATTIVPKTANLKENISEIIKARYNSVSVF